MLTKDEMMGVIATEAAEMIAAPDPWKTRPAEEVGSTALLEELEAARKCVADLHGALHAHGAWGYGHLCSQIESALENASNSLRRHSSNAKIS